MTTFQTEYLFKRLSDFWDYFEDREDVKNIWDAYLRKAQALQGLLVQADLSKSLSTIPLFDRNDLEYFVFESLTRRTDLEKNPSFYVYEVDSTIFFIKDLNEKIDDTLANRVLSPPGFYRVISGAGEDEGKTFLEFLRGVAPTSLGQTYWTRGSDVVTGAGFQEKVQVGDIVQGYNQQFFKVLEVTSDTALKVQGPTTFDEDLGPGDGVQTVFNLAATALVIPGSVVIQVDGVTVDPGDYTATAAGVITFATAPAATVQSITASYHLGYTGPTAYNRRTVKESVPDRLYSKAVYRDRRSIFTNFGSQIGLDRPTSFQYLNQVRGIYFARWNGPVTANMDLGAGILIDLPFSARGTVSKVNSTDPKSIVIHGDLIQVPPPLNIEVSVGQELPRDFNLLTDGVRTADFINDPALFNLEPLKSNPAKFFTFLVLVKGTYATHVAVQTGQPIDYTLLKRFKSEIKPSYTDFLVVTYMDHIADNLGLFMGPVDIMNVLEATATVEFNLLNWSVVPEFMQNAGFPYTVADELVASGPFSAGPVYLLYGQVKPGTLELHAGTIGGTLLVDPTHYTVDLTTGVITLTAAGATLLNAAAPQELHALYTSGLVGEAALAASGLADMDSDSVGVYEELGPFLDALGISTLENNLVNFGVSPPGPEAMDECSLEFTYAVQINEAVGTPPGSFNPPFTPGALIYTTP